MTENNTMWFRSKVDWWLGLLLAVAPVVTVIVALSAPADERMAAYGSTLLLAAVYVGILFPTTYGLDGTTLTVRHGFVRRRIRLAAITEVRPTRNPLSSPALSLDRLRITYGEGWFKLVLTRRPTSGASSPSWRCALDSRGAVTVSFAESRVATHMIGIRRWRPPGNRSRRLLPV